MQPGTYGVCTNATPANWSRQAVRPHLKRAGCAGASLFCPAERAGLASHSMMPAPMVACRGNGPRAEAVTAEATAAPREHNALVAPNSKDAPSPSTAAQKRDRDSLDWYNQWYPVAFVRDVDKAAPVRFVLLNTPLVLWWDANAQAWRAFRDVCPHRLVPLSEGRINKARGTLECGYHGWEFSGAGKCERIPQEGKSDMPRACATAYPCAERQGLLFVKPKELPRALMSDGAASLDAAAELAAAVADEQRIPAVPELEEGGWLAQDTWRDLPMDWATLLDNVLDASHVPFTHHASMSNRNVIGPYDMKLTSDVTPTGFSGMWATGPRAGQLGPQSTTFSPPGFMRHRLDSKAFSSIIAVYSVPTSPGRCRLINRNIVRFEQSSLPSAIIKLIPGWCGHVGSHVVLEDDQIFLHLGEEEMARRRAAGQTLGQAAYMPSTADTYIAALHTWINRYGGGGPFGHMTAAQLAALGPRLSREQLLDRYSQHTAHCASCQKGLAQVRAAVGMAAGAAAVCGLLAAVSFAAGVTAAGGGVGVGVTPAPSGASGLLSSVGGAVLTVLQGACGAPDPTGVGQVLRGTAWLAAAAAALVVRSKLQALESAFFKGAYPPPRNLKE